MYHFTNNLNYAILSTLILIVSIIISKIKYGFLLYVSLVPNISMFKISDDSTALLSIIVLILLIKTVFHPEFKINLNLLIGGTFFLILSITSYSIEGNLLGLISQDIRMILSLILIYSIFLIHKKETENILILLLVSFVFGTIFAGIIGFLNLKFILNNSYSRLFPLEGDPNYFAVCVALSIIIIFVLNLRLTHYVVITSFVQLLLLVFGLLSYSRGFLLCLIPIVLMSIISRNQRNSKVAFSSAVLLIWSLIIFKDYISLMLKEFIYRFTLEEYEGGSGRVEIWSYYFNYYLSEVKFLFIGIGTQFIEIPGLGEKSQHNIVLELITSKGLIGTGIVMFLYVIMFQQMKEILRVNKLSIVDFFPFISILIGFLFLNGIVSDIGVITLNLSLYLSILYKKFRKR